MKIREGAFLRCCKNQGIFDDRQFVVPQLIQTHIFHACHHHKLAAHQDMVHTLTLIKEVVLLIQYAERH